MNIDFYKNPPPYFEIYSQKQKDWLELIKNHKKSRAITYIQHESGGMSNKLRGLMCVTVLAMLTNRAILLNNWPSFSTYYSTPLETMQPPVEEYPIGRLYEDYDTCFDDEQIKEMVNWRKKSYLSILTYCDLLESFLKYRKFNKKLYKYGLISERSQNDITKQAIEIRYFMYKYFFKPSMRVENEIYKVLKKFESNIVIGMHFRTNHEDWNDVGVKFLSNSQIENVVKEIEENSNTQKSKLKWYIATDNNRLLNKFIYEYSDYIISEVHRKEHSRIAGYIDEKVFVFTLVDSFVLSYCPILYLTSSSSFSHIAYYRSDLSISRLLSKEEWNCEYCGVNWIESE